MRKLYLRPLVSADYWVGRDDAVRLGGSMVCASQFVLIVRGKGEPPSHRLAAAADMRAMIGGLPDELALQGEAQWAALHIAPASLAHPNRVAMLDDPQVMGILNVTPDSFSDGGSFLNPDVAAEHASSMIEAGATIIDIGGESTRPGAAEVDQKDEIARVVPAVERLAGMGVMISVDTRRPAVMEAALLAGAHIINDVSALGDPRGLEVVAASGAPVVLMHAPGSGDNLHADGSYDEVVFEVFDWLAARRDVAIAAGIAREKIVLDPGIGFGKSLADNMALMNALPLFHALGQPLLVGASRKRMIGALANDAPADRRLGGSLALALKALDAGVQILRVHDVFETAQAVQVWQGLRRAAQR